MDEIIQLKITLERTKPPIWRRILVDKETTFFELHHIIQISMGWFNSHLYEFDFKNFLIGEPDDEFGSGISRILKASEVTLGSMITAPKETFKYEYDFGDGWGHKILVEKFLARDPKNQYPSCIAGKLNCPPEDCGGVGGFYQMLDVLANKKHPGRKEMIEWLGEEYDSKYFKIDEINEELNDLDGYIEFWTDDKF